MKTMQIIKGDKVIYSFNHTMEAVAQVKNGETFKVIANDCFFQQITAEKQNLNAINYDLLNPATGPIYVADAAPGDILKVEIIEIEVADKGVSLTAPNEGVLKDQSTKGITRIIPVEDGHARFQGVNIPIDPMIGVIGVAPAKEDGDWPTSTPWKHGGNMDTIDNRAGSTLYFPVKQEGALLALGDCHAVMADGEACFTGLEIPAEVTLRTSVIKNKKLTWPIVETPEANMLIVSNETVEGALYEATSEAVKLMQKALNIAWEDAYIMSSLTTDLKISQIVDPRMTVRAAIPKFVLPTETLIAALN